MNNRVIIVEDHPAVRLALRLLLSSEGYDVVAETGDGGDVLDMVESHKPSLMILDLGIPSVDSLTIIGQLADKQPSVKIVVYTGLALEHLPDCCRKMGARGFVKKNSELSELVHAVRAVRADDEYFASPSCLSQLYGDEQEYASIARLSTREYKVMQYLMQGMRHSEIADCMGFNQKTVSTYKMRIFHKLKLTGMADLYAMAKRNGIL